MVSQSEGNERETWSDPREYAEAFYDHLADLRSQKQKLDDAVSYLKNAKKKLEESNKALLQEKEQLEKSIAELKEIIQDVDDVPWSFTIVFDESKAQHHGYDINELYDCVDENVQRYGLTRLAQGTWKANEQDRVESQCLAVSLLSKQDWVMQNIASFTVHENGTTAIDYLEIIKEQFPQRVYD